MLATNMFYFEQCAEFVKVLKVYKMLKFNSSVCKVRNMHEFEFTPKKCVIFNTIWCLIYTFTCLNQRLLNTLMEQFCHHWC